MPPLTPRLKASCTRLCAFSNLNHARKKAAILDMYRVNKSRNDGGEEMYTRVTRYSFNGSNAEKEGAKLYEQAKPMWSGQQGFHSMQRYRIVEGPNANQQM